MRLVRLLAALALGLVGCGDAPRCPFAPAIVPVTPAIGSAVPEGEITLTWSEPLEDAELTLTTRDGATVYPVSGTSLTLMLAPDIYMWSVHGSYRDVDADCLREVDSVPGAFRVAAPAAPVAGAISDAAIGTELLGASLVLARVRLWHGLPGHIDVGYVSDSDVTAARHVSETAARGFAGLVADWYGPAGRTADSAPQDSAFGRLLAAAGQEGGTRVALAYHQEALLGAADPTAGAIADLADAHGRFMADPAYLTGPDARPIVLWVPAALPAVDVAAVHAALAALTPAPLLLDEDPEAATAPDVDGFYAWPKPGGGVWNGSDWGEAYLTSFYTALQGPFAGELAMGALWPGFDDGLAAWGSGRVMDRRCGETFYDTLSLLTAADAITPVPLVQVATWNDPEEGTAVEDGLDACLEITVTATRDAAAGADRVAWSVTGTSALVARWDIYAAPVDDPAAEILVVSVSDSSEELVVRAYPESVYRYRVAAVGRALVRGAVSALVEAR